MSENEKLVEVQHLQQYFPAGGRGKHKKFVQAVDDVSFFINRGETLGLVGESGCGKTTVGRTLLRLYEPTDGKIIYDGKVIFDKENKVAVNMLPYRRKMQMVFQDPYASLDPRMTIGDIVGEPIDIHHLAANKAERREKIISLLERVGLNSEHANRYPHAPAVSASESASRERLRSIPSSSSAMSRSPRSTSPFRRRSSICSRIFRRSSD